MTATLTLSARRPDELDAIDEWLVDCWLDAPVGPVPADGALKLSLEQSPDDVASETSGLPQPRNQRKTAWYEEHEQPVVACTLTIRHVEEIVTAPEEGLPLCSGVEFDQASRTLAFDDDVLQVRVLELDVELDVTTHVVAWRRKRLWRVGPLMFET